MTTAQLPHQFRDMATRFETATASEEIAETLEIECPWDSHAAQLDGRAGGLRVKQQQQVKTADENEHDNGEGRLFVCPAGR